MSPGPYLDFVIPYRGSKTEKLLHRLYNDTRINSAINDYRSGKACLWKPLRGDEDGQITIERFGSSKNDVPNAKWQGYSTLQLQADDWTVSLLEDVDTAVFGEDIFSVYIWTRLKPGEIRTLNDELFWAKASAYDMVQLLDTHVRAFCSETLLSPRT